MYVHCKLDTTNSSLAGYVLTLRNQTSDLAGFFLKIDSVLIGPAVRGLLILQGIAAELQVEVGSRGNERLP